MTTDGHPSFRPARLSPRPLYGALLLAWVLILVVVVVFLVMLGVERARVEFEEHAGQIHSELTTRLQFNELALNGFAAFLTVANRDERAAVTHYASALLQQTHHIHALEVVEEVKAEQVGTFLDEMRLAGYPELAIRDFDYEGTRRWLPAAPRPVYYPISLIVSLNAGLDELLGLDVGQVDSLRDAMLRALNQPGSHATPPFELYEGGRGYGVFQRIDPGMANGKRRQARCLALLIVRVADLLPESALMTEYDFHTTLRTHETAGDAGLVLLERPSRPDGWLASTLLPTLHYTRQIEGSVPAVSLTIERRLTWKEVNFPLIAWVMFAATLTLLLLHVYMSAHRHSEARRLELEELLRYKAHHDELTGLPNRTLIIDRIEQGIRDAHRDKQSLAVLFLDLNGFKPVNDTYGHEAGDRVLHEVAQRLRTVVRERDTVGRMSGDEFIMILADTDRAGCDVVIDKIKNTFNPPFSLDAETKLAMGISIGVAIHPDDGMTPGELMRVADSDMYRHKPRRE
ncbi:MAG TPA: sensor domain-containing diguanylate cyclase [Gammaproteobacteria bacterium]